MTTRHMRPASSSTSSTDLFARKEPATGNQFVHLQRPALHKRELLVRDAVFTLPVESRTPSAAAHAILLQGLDIPYSTLAQILRRLERKGVIQLGRKRP